MTIDTVVEKALEEQPAASYHPYSGLRHRASAATKWRNGQESVNAALKEIQDALHSLPGYREAEETNDRDGQVGIIARLITQTPSLTDYFFSHGLRDLMRKFVDKTGRTGLKKLGSVSALLEFYSKRKRLEWFSTAYAVHLATDRSGKLMVEDRRPQLSDAAKKFAEGINLEAVVSALSGEFGVSGRHRELGLSFITNRLEWLSRHRVYDTLTERVIRDELQQFYYERGIIPINTAEGQKRIKSARDLRLLSAFRLGILSRGNRHDEEFFRHYKRISERTRKGKGPARADMIDQHGQMEELKSYYGRPISYDDVLAVEDVMRRYLTGQRSVTVQIGSQSMQMTPETQEDLWIMNQRFIKLRINGKLVNERLYYFWRRVKSGEDGTEKYSADGDEPWSALFNHEGRQTMAISYFGTAATLEAVATNPKARFIKKGPLPSRELARLGLLTEMPKEESQKGRRAKPAISEVEPEQSTGTGNNEQSPLYGGRRVINYGVFRGYVPRNQLAAEVFRRKLLERVIRRPVYMGEAVALAEEVGFESRKGNGIDAQVRRVLREWPTDMPKIVELVDPNAPNIKNAPSYWGLEKYTGEKGEPVNSLLYGPLEQAVKEAHPDYSSKAVHQSAGIIVSMLEHSGVLTKGDLENLLASGSLENIRSVSGRGLMSRDPRQRTYLNYFVRACEAAGFDTTGVKALVGEVAASSA